MTIYFLTILIIFYFSFLDIRYTLSLSTKRYMISAVYLLLVIQVGLRWETGTDWNPYLDHFKSIENFDSTSPLVNGFEYGYSIMVWAIKHIYADYSFFLLIHAIIYYLLILRSFQRYTPYLFISLLMFYTLSIGMMGSNRQLIALAICLYSLKYLNDNKPFLFFLLVIIAINFHTTAFVFIIYYFLNRKINPYFIIVVLGCSFIIGKSQLPLNFFSYVGDLIGGHSATKTLIYLDSAKDVLSELNLSMIGLIKRIVFLAFFYYNRKKLSEILPYYNLMLNGYAFGIALYFLFADSLLIIVSRGSLYFNIMEPLLIASQVCLLKRKENKIMVIALLLVFSFFFFFQSIITYPDLFLPYKGIFINSDYLRNLH